MRFLKSLQQDAKLFLYIYLLLMLFRIAFLAIYAGQMGSAGVGDILTALWLGRGSVSRRRRSWWRSRFFSLRSRMRSTRSGRWQVFERCWGVSRFL